MLVLTKKEDPFHVRRLYFDNYYNIKYVIKFKIKKAAKIKLKNNIFIFLNTTQISFNPYLVVAQKQAES